LQVLVEGLPPLFVDGKFVTNVCLDKIYPSSVQWLHGWFVPQESIQSIGNTWSHPTTSPAHLFFTWLSNDVEKDVLIIEGKAG
jgi:hypothetical protein